MCRRFNAITSFAFVVLVTVLLLGCPADSDPDPLDLAEPRPGDIPTFEGTVPDTASAAETLFVGAVGALFDVMDGTPVSSSMLRPGGRLAVSALLVDETIPDSWNETYNGSAGGTLIDQGTSLESYRMDGPAEDPPSFPATFRIRFSGEEQGTITAEELKHLHGGVEYTMSGSGQHASEFGMDMQVTMESEEVGSGTLSVSMREAITFGMSVSAGGSGAKFVLSAQAARTLDQSIDGLFGVGDEEELPIDPDQMEIDVVLKMFDANNTLVFTIENPQSFIDLLMEADL